MLKNQYTIPFKSLEDGVHHYTFEVGKFFFSQFEDSLIHEGQVDISVSMYKRPTFLEFDFELSGTVQVQCDRCLDYFDLEIEHEESLIVKFGKDVTELSDVDEMMTISEAEHEIDLSQHIYEYIALSVPYQHIHPDDEDGNSTCNPEMLVELEKILITESNKPTDTRWDKLKDLLN